MKAFLMYRDRDFDLEHEPPADEAALTQDLGLNTLFKAMALEDEFLLDMSRHGVLASLADADAVLYRQQVLEDCLRHGPAVRELYALVLETLRRERQYWRSVFEYPTGILARAVQAMELYVEMLGRLRELAEQHAADFRSEGFSRFFAMLREELGDEYLEEIEAHLRQLKFNKGVLISAELGKGNKGIGYVLRQAPKMGWLERLTGDHSALTLRIPDRDENGARALGELRDRGINLAANALAQSSDHILSFFTLLRRELGFYIGCLNLHERLEERGAPHGFPVPRPAGTPELQASGLYDLGLSLRTDEPLVGNDLDADGATLVMITGANQGGKSTLLRSLGLAQLMMQAGMFVAAESFSADVRDALFTHFRRDEDETMNSGKLDEELARMSDIVDRLTPGAMVLCNESFAATNEREGSAIAREIIRALREAGVKVVFVTHMFDLAHTLYREGTETARFLRAERRDDGRRTFKLDEGEPLATSYGPDLYDRIFGSVAFASHAPSNGSPA